MVTEDINIGPNKSTKEVTSNRIANNAAHKHVATNIQDKPNSNPTQFGRDYEGYLAMLFILRGAINKYRFKVGVEIEQAHKFDDLIFIYNRAGKNAGRCLQAKHTTSNKKKIDSMNLLTIGQSDFSIVKYFFAFKDMMREDYFHGIIQEDLIVYTNFELDVDSKIGPKMKRWQEFGSMKDDKINKLTQLLEPINSPDDILDLTKEDSKRYRFKDELVDILESKVNEYSIVRLAQTFKDWLMGKKKLQEVEHTIRPYWKFLTEEILDIENGRLRESFLKEQKKFRSKEAQIFHEILKEEIKRKNTQNKKKIEKYQDEILSIESLSERVGTIGEYPSWKVDLEVKFDNMVKVEDTPT
ncbi:uncharacterized protein LOC143919431 [Arctopsyche grandis]|uniref:uncharacterized protein LOC143919431 n=1 Tax=Arctopsyche grandis TaxID=121162 RepID=UPI00406D7599